MANARQVGPAHAGMDPTSPSRPPPSGGLPRTRGDGPPLIMCFQTNSGHRNTRLVAGFTEHGDETTFERTPILAATARNPRILTRSAEGTTIRDIRYRDEQVHVASGPSTGRISR